MSIFDRLGDVIKSYLNDEDESLFGKQENPSRSKDADYNAAYDELNDYLNKDKAKSYAWKDEEVEENHQTDDSRNHTSYTDYINAEFARKQAERKAAREQERVNAEAYAKAEKQRRERAQEAERQKAKNTSNEYFKDENPNVPEILRSDFAELGIDFGSDLADCKAAYKTLLKKHHPDRHAGHPRNMKKATEKSARINVSYHRIETWYETGKIG